MTDETLSAPRPLALRDVVRSILALVWLVLLWSTAIQLLALPIQFRRGRRWARRYIERGALFQATLWLAGIRIEVKGLDNLLPGESYLFVAPHSSFLDPPALALALGATPNFFTTARLFSQKFGLLGYCMRRLGHIPVKTGGRQEMLALGEEQARLAAGLVIFPEGGRSQDGTIGHF